MPLLLSNPSRHLTAKWLQLSIVTLFVAQVCLCTARAEDKNQIARQMSGAPSAQSLAKLFDDVCYTPLPDFTAIRAMAKKNGWTAITGDELQKFAPEVPPDVLEAWRVTLSGQPVSIAISSSPIDQQLAKAFPDFATARAFACTVIPPPVTSSEDMNKALRALIGRDRDESFENAPFTVHLWSGVTDTMAALLYHYQPQSRPHGGLISFVVLKK